MNWQAVPELKQKMENKLKFFNKAKQTMPGKNACAMEMTSSKNSILIVKSTQTVDKQTLKRRIN